MTTNGPIPEPDLRGWAAAVLELPRDATPNQVRSALLRCLPDEDFVLSYRNHQAALFLLRQQDGGECALRQGQAAYDEEDRLRIEVEAFAAEFFRLAVPERRQRWYALRSRTTFCPPLHMRVASLENGLDIELESVSTKETRELAGRLAEMFVVLPAARAVRRRALLREAAASAPQWQAAARHIRKQAPAVAALAPHLVEELASCEQRARQQQQRAATLGKRPLHRVAAISPENAPASGGPRRTPGWLIVFIVMMLVNAMRLAVPSSGDSSPKIRQPDRLPRLDELQREIDRNSRLQRGPDDDEHLRRVFPGMPDELPPDQEFEKKLKRLRNAANGTQKTAKPTPPSFPSRPHE